MTIWSEETRRGSAKAIATRAALATSPSTSPLPRASRAPSTAQAACWRITTAAALQCPWEALLARLRRTEGPRATTTAIRLAGPEQPRASIRDTRPCHTHNPPPRATSSRLPRLEVPSLAVRFKASRVRMPRGKASNLRARVSLRAPSCLVALPRASSQF